MKFRSILRRLGLGDGRLLLDLGCGDGSFARLAARQGFRGFGLDISPRLVKIAKDRRTQNFDFQSYDITDQLPFPPANYDVVAALDVLEHLEQPVRTLREIHRVLRENGQLVASVPTFESGDLYGDPDHKVFLGFSQWRNLFDTTGWRIMAEEIFPWAWLNRLNRRWTCPIFFLQKGEPEKPS